MFRNFLWGRILAALLSPTIVLVLGACAHKPTPLPQIALSDLEMPSDAELKVRVPAASASGMKSYVGIDLELAPYAALTKHLSKIEKVDLQTRGEAHITVITPPELQVLTQKLKKQEIQALADDLELENTGFRALCAGKAQVDSNRTYFVVVSSEDLFNFRSQVQKLFEKKGGPKGAFQSENYHPHITLGFQGRDLHEHDGVIKDERTCFYVFDEETEDLLSSKTR